MKRKLKLLSATILASLLTFGCIVSCESKDPDINDKDPSDDNDGEIIVEELFIRTPPKKTKYYIGDIFDSTGMKVKARYSDGLVLSVDLTKCEISPLTPLTSSDTKVTITYEGKSVEQPIQILDVAVTSIRIDVGNTPLTAAANTPMDFSRISVYATYEDGNEVMLNGGYSFEVDGKATEDISSLIFKDWGKHTLTVIYGDLRENIEITIFDGFIVEAENMLKKEEVSEDTKNYVEIYKGSSSGNPSKIQKDSEPASGGAYMGSVFNGSVIRFHLYAEEDCYVETILRASSAYMTIDGGAWSPMEMGDQQFNRLFKIKYGSASEAESNNLSPLDISDDVILEGGSTEQPGGNPLLYVNWKDVNFGVIPLKKGDNIVELTVITDYINCHSENVACNIDRFEVKYTDDYTPPATVESINITTPPDKVEYKVGEIFDPTGMKVKASMSDNTSKDIPLDDLNIEPSGPLSIEIEEVKISYRGANTTQNITVTEAPKFTSVKIEGENLITNPSVSDINYVESVRTGYQGAPGVQNTEAGEYANTSEGKYLKGLFGDRGNGGATIRFHIWANEDVENVEIKAAVCGSNVIESVDGNPWHPSKTADVDFANIFKVRYGTSEKLEDVTLPEDMIVKGGEYTPDGDVVLEKSFALFEDWQEISLGGFSLKAGDNILELENINSSLANLAGETYGLNIDYLTVTAGEYIPTAKVESIFIEQAPNKIIYQAGETFDPTGMIIKANMSDGGTKDVDLSKCNISPSGILTPSDKEIKITYRGFTVTQPITVEGQMFAFEAENLVNSLPTEEKNYVEVVQNGKGWYVKKQNTEVNDGSVDTSNGAYLNGLCGHDEEGKGSIIRIHINSEIEQKADISIKASSPYAIENGESIWHPKTTGDMQFNKVYKTKFGYSSDSLTPVAIDDSVIVQGDTRDDGNGGMTGASCSLLENWKVVSLGEFDLHVGDNIIELENINKTDYISPEGQILGLNIDMFLVQYK